MKAAAALIIICALLGMAAANEYEHYWVNPGPNEYVEITYLSAIIAVTGNVMFAEASAYQGIDVRTVNLTSHETTHHWLITGTGHGNVTVMEEM